MVPRFPQRCRSHIDFDGRSWRDELCAAGFHVWGLDFHGFGRSRIRTREWSDTQRACHRSGGPRMPAARSSRPSVSSPHTTVFGASPSSRIPGGRWPRVASLAAAPSRRHAMRRRHSTRFFPVSRMADLLRCFLLKLLSSALKSRLSN